MQLKKDFNKEKIVVYSVWIFIAVIALGNWVATSFGTFDIDLSKIFYKGMDNNVLRGWAAYTIEDGYCTMIPWLIPSGLLLIECLWKYTKKAKPNWWISQHINLYKYFIILVALIFEFVVLHAFWLFNWKDQGFGAGYSMEFVTGREYTIPSFVVSTVMSNIVFWTLVWWYHCKLAKRPDFLELKLWRNSIRIFLYMGFAYLITQIAKFANPRPYWYAIHFTDGLVYPDGKVDYSSDKVVGILQRYQELYPNQFKYYLSEANHHQVGWWGNLDYASLKAKISRWPDEWKGRTDFRNFRWYRNANDLPFWSYPAFPSGHMNATIIVCLTPTLAFGFKTESKKVNRARKVSIAIAFLYSFDMAFALQMTQSHYWSDIVFSMGWSIVYWIAAHYTMIGLTKIMNTWFNTTKW